MLILGERQTWRFEPIASGTHVSVLAEMTGPAARLLQRRLAERLQTVVVSVLDLLRLEAEMRKAEAEDEAARAADAVGDAR